MNNLETISTYCHNNIEYFSKIRTEIEKTYSNDDDSLFAYYGGVIHALKEIFEICSTLSLATKLTRREKENA